jgi:hypothetical protein
LLDPSRSSTFYYVGYGTIQSAEPEKQIFNDILDLISVSFFLSFNDYRRNIQYNNICYRYLILPFPNYSDSDTPSGPPGQSSTSQRISVTPPSKSSSTAGKASAVAASPRKSYLGGAAPAFAKSPLKAASDRILRKYTTSPLKKRQSLREGIRRRPMFSPVKAAAAAITPRRLVALAPPANKTCGGGGGEGTPACAASGTPPAAPCRGSPALTSPRGGGEEDQDTPTAGGRRKTRLQKVRKILTSRSFFSSSSRT